jgi:hypothetical protein
MRLAEEILRIFDTHKIPIPKIARSYRNTNKWYYRTLEYWKNPYQEYLDEVSEDIRKEV